MPPHSKIKILRTGIICLALITIALVFAAPLVLAAPATIPNPLGPGATFSTIITRITDFALTLLAPLSTLMVLIAGFLYMTGGGNPEKIKAAHTTLVWALVGIAVVLLAKSAELIIRDVLGIK